MKSNPVLIQELVDYNENYQAGMDQVLVHEQTGNRDVIVISDLHIAAGKGAEGRYDGTENFFSDESFERFIDYLQQEYFSSKGAILVINGDFIDFLRIRNYPVTDEEFSCWQNMLNRIGIHKSIDELKKSIIPKEKEYGLRTDDYKSVWKLHVCFSGHPLIFRALSKWLLNGHSVFITKGNHDLEWFWVAVRNYLRLILAEQMEEQIKSPLATNLTKYIFPNLKFFDDSILFDNVFYIEHGMRYDKYGHVVGGPLLKNQTELNIPFGSFFNRYLINTIELSYPYLDNVRPTTNILPLLIRERFPLALKLIFKHFFFALKIIPKNYYSYMFKYFVTVLLAILIPVFIIGYVFLKQHPEASDSINTIWKYSKSLVLLIGSYFLSRIVAYFQLTEPSDLCRNANSIFKENPGLKIITMGHTHNPTQFNSNEKWFFNTGTWIPVFEIDSADVRMDKTFTFLHVLNINGTLQPRNLQRWNDDALRCDPLIVVKKN